jgi:replicative DNA helicase
MTDWQIPDADPWAGMGMTLPKHPSLMPTDSPAYVEWQATTAAEKELRRAQQLAEATERELIRLRAQHAAKEQFAAEEAEKAKKAVAESARVFTGGSFLLDIPDTPPAIWGKGDDVLWAEGESLIIAGPQGVGKTTIAGQLLRGLVGLQSEVLGFPIEAAKKRVGYLAMDRPAQARRALGRMFREEERGFIDEMIRFWAGPLPTDAAVDPETFVRIARQIEAEVLFVDSMKDAAIGLSKDEVGAGYNRARQFALAEGIQIAELHHVVKNGVDGKQPKNLAGVYGSTWLTSGAGSVVMLWGEAGDPIIDLTHLKQPLNEVGPFKVRHNRETGISEVFHDEDTDVIALARGASAGISAHEAAACLFSAEKPSTAQVEKARRKLAKFVADGLLVEHGSGGGRGKAARWFAVAPASWSDDSDDRGWGE